MSNACSSNWRSMSLYFIAAKACTCTQIHRDLPVTSHCITVMVFQSRCGIHSIFMNFPHCCFFLFPRLVGVSGSLGYPRLPPLHIPFPEARGRGVTCNCQHLPTNNWGPNIEHKDSQSTLLRVKLLPAFGSGNLMPKGDTNKHWTNLKFEKCLRHRKSHSAPRLVVLMCCPEVRELCQRCDTVLYARWQWVAPRQYVGNVGNDGNVMWICFHNEFPMPSKAMDLVGAAVDVLDHFQLGEGTPWNTWLENADIKVSSGLFNADKLEAQ